MKVLWFTNNITNYKPVSSEGNSRDNYNGGGWLSSALTALSTEKDLDVCVSFICNGQPTKVVQDGITYYPIKDPMNMNRANHLYKIIRMVGGIDVIGYERSLWPSFLHAFKDVIEDAKPDIIHVWGFEQYFGLVSKVTDIPVVLHIQGLLNPIYNAYFPPTVSWRKYLLSKLSIKTIADRLLERSVWQMDTYRENEIMTSVDGFLGRTTFDKIVTEEYNPGARYFKVDEILRSSFYVPEERSIPQKLIIVSTLSKPQYRGLDVVLKTAQILKKVMHVDFEWHCYGNTAYSTVSKMVGIKAEDVNVILKGVANEKLIKEALLHCTLYMQPAYIDNSPNSVCEAQMLSVPVVSTNVGGIPSLVVHKETGYLVPSNDPYQSAYYIKQLYDDKQLNIQLGRAGYEVAVVRHDKQRIINQIKGVYKSFV